MSSIDSTSTIAHIEAAYMDNLSYEEDGSVAKCKAFVTACRAWLVKHPRSQAHAGEELQLNVEAVSEALKEARAWLSVNRGVTDGGYGMKTAGFDGFRG